MEDVSIICSREEIKRRERAMINVLCQCRNITAIIFVALHFISMGEDCYSGIKKILHPLKHDCKAAPPILP